LDVLTGSYMVRVLPPWFENVGKRQRKAPKVYLRDTGLMHSLLGLRGLADVLKHPKAGASWEGFALEQILRLLPTRDAYYWAVHGGAELDLFIQHSGKRIGFEFKRADAPELTRSMQTAICPSTASGWFFRGSELMISASGSEHYRWLSLPRSSADPGSLEMVPRPP
jgi:hypothetical protein